MQAGVFEQKVGGLDAYFAALGQRVKQDKPSGKEKHKSLLTINCSSL